MSGRAGFIGRRALLALALVVASGVARAAFEELESFKKHAAADVEELVRSSVAEFFTLAKLPQPTAVRIEAKPDVVRVGKDLHLRSIVVDTTIVTDHPPSVVREARLHVVRDLMTRGYRTTDEPEAGEEMKPYLLLRVDAELPALAESAWRTHIQEFAVVAAMALATMSGLALAVLLFVRAFVAPARKRAQNRTDAGRRDAGATATGGARVASGRNSEPEVGLPEPPQVLPQVALPPPPSAVVPVPRVTEARAAGRLPEVPDAGGVAPQERPTGAVSAGAAKPGTVRVGATPGTDWLVGATKRGSQDADERVGASAHPSVDDALLALPSPPTALAPLGGASEAPPPPPADPRLPGPAAESRAARSGASLAGGGPELLTTPRDLLLETFERMPFEKALALLAGLDPATRRTLLERLALAAPVRQRIERALAETYGI